MSRQIFYFFKIAKISHFKKKCLDMSRHFSTNLTGYPQIFDKKSQNYLKKSFFIELDTEICLDMSRHNSTYQQVMNIPLKSKRADTDSPCRP